MGQRCLVFRSMSLFLEPKLGLLMRKAKHHTRTECWLVDWVCRSISLCLEFQGPQMETFRPCIGYTLGWCTPFSEECLISKPIQRQKQQQQQPTQLLTQSRRQILVVPPPCSNPKIPQIQTRLKISDVNHLQKLKNYSGRLPGFSLQILLM